MCPEDHGYHSILNGCYHCEREARAAGELRGGRAANEPGEKKKKKKKASKKHQNKKKK